MPTLLTPVFQVNRMSAQTTLSIEIPLETKRELEEYARATEQSTEFIAKEAIDAHLADRRAYLAAIDEAIREADEGVFISGDAVFRWIDSLGSENELPLPEPDIFPTTRA